MNEKKKVVHKIVPNGTLGNDLETADRHTRQVNEYLKRGSLPASFYKKRGLPIPDGKTNKGES